MSRVQVNDLQSPLTPRTTSRPTAVPMGAPDIAVTPGMQLADALSNFQPELRGYLVDMRDENRNRERAAAYDRIQGMTFEEAQAEVAGGTMRDTESPFFQAAFNKQFGLAYAANRRKEIADAYYNGFDRQSGDLDGFLADFARQDVTEYGDNPFILSGIREGMGGFFERVREDSAEFRQNYTHQQVGEQFYQIASAVADEAVADGADPSAAVRALYGEHRKAFGLSYAEMDGQVMTLAGRYAEAGDLAAVEALLTADVTGEDGQKIGSFLNRPEYAEDAQRLINSAKANQGEFLRKSNTSEVVRLRETAQRGSLQPADVEALTAMRDSSQMSQAEYESLLVSNAGARGRALDDSYTAVAKSDYDAYVAKSVNEGKGYALTDYTFISPSGAEHTFKADEAVSAFVQEQLTEMAERQASPSQMAAQLASWGVAANYKVWENSLSNGYLSIHEALSAPGKDGGIVLAEPARAGYATWKALSEYPYLRQRHVKDARAAQVYQDAEALERLGTPVDTALVQAASIGPAERERGLATSFDRNEFAAAIKSASSGGGYLTDNVSNSGDVGRAIEQAAMIYVGLGHSPSAALKEAARVYDEAHTPINGVSINTRARNIFPTFQEASRYALEAFAVQVDEDVDDLTLIPASGNQDFWIVAYKSSLMPHPDYASGGRFTGKQLQANWDEQRAAETETARKAAAAVEQERLDKANRRAKRKEAGQKRRDAIRKDRAYNSE